MPNLDFKNLRMTPLQTKKYFNENGWTKIIGFQTRNPIHKSHYMLTLNALKQVGDDACLLLHPVVGITQDCDIEYHTRVRCYKKLLKYYDNNRVLLSLLNLSMRMAGPKEALLHAIIRRNYGCTHFIVGRDHAGPSYKNKNGDNFYEPYAAQELLLKYADKIGIKVIVSEMIVYAINKNTNIGKYLEIGKVDKNNYDILDISGSELRHRLKNNIKIPEWYSFPEIIEELMNENKNTNGLCIYLVGLSGSGKSTIANGLIEKFREITNRKVTLLDADIVRQHLSKGLGFSKEDRSINVRRIGYVAYEIVKHGGIVIVANIAPYLEDRLYNKELISSVGKYYQIYVNTSLEVCINRDVKGLYKLALEGKINNFTGINDTFIEPDESDLIVDGNTNLDDIINNIFVFVNFSI